MGNKYIIFFLFLLAFIVIVPQKSHAQSPENVLNEMRSLDLEKMSMKQYYEKLFSYYDSPSREFFNNYLQSSAEDLDMSVDDYYKVLDDFKQAFQNVSFDGFTNLTSNGSPYRVCISNYSEKRTIDKNNIIGITEKADFNIHKYVNLMCEKFPGLFDKSSKDEYEVVIKNSLGYMYDNGQLINKTIFVKENEVWKIHVTKQLADKIFPANKYVDKLDEKIPEKKEIIPKQEEDIPKQEETTPKQKKINPQAEEITPTPENPNPVKENAESMLAKAQQYEQNKEFDSAAEEYKKVALFYPYSKYTSSCIKNEAIIYFKHKKYNEVIEALKSFDLKDNWTNKNLINLSNYLNGMSYYLKKNPDYNYASYYLEKVAEAEPHNRNTQNALHVLGICYENLQHYDDAIELYKKIYNLHGHDQSEALYKIGKFYALKKEVDKSNKYLIQYITDFPNDKYCDIANYRLGKNHLSGKAPNYDSAIVFFHSALSNTTDQELIVKLYYNMGECYFKLKKWDACKASFSKVMKAPLQYNNPDEFVRMRNTASIRLSQMKDEIPKDYYHRGITALDSSNYQKAFEYFEKIIKIHDEKYYAQSILNASWCEFKLKHYDNAYSLLKNHNSPEIYNIDPQKYQYIYGLSLLYKKYPNYTDALFYLQHLHLSEAPSKENRNLISYSIGLCYEKKGDKKQVNDKEQAIDDYVNAISEYNNFINDFPNDKNYSVAKKTIKTLNQTIKKLEQKIKDEEEFNFDDFYSYKKKISNDTLIITIVDLLKSSHLQPDGNHSLIYIPVNIDKVFINQKVKIILKQVPFFDSRLAYMNVSVDVPRSNANVFKPSINIQVSQDYQCCKNGTNNIEVENLFGIWDLGFDSSFDYAKQMIFQFTINSLGRTFHGNIGGRKKESPLLISIFLGNSENVAVALINKAKKKGARILYISGMGTD